MKYLITESKFNDTIKTYILSEFNMVHDVYFTTKTVVLGSSEGYPIIERNIINVVINNSKNELKYRDLKDISNDIIDSVDGVFNLNVLKYSSKWEFNVGQLAIVDLKSELLK